MPGDYAQLADQRDDLRAATNPLPVPLRQDDGSGVFPIVTSHDFSTDPDDEQGPFFDVSTALFAVLEVCPARSMFHRTFTYEIVSGFDPEQTFAVEINGVAASTVGVAGDTPADVLQALLTAAQAAGGSVVTGGRVYATTSGTGFLDLYGPFTAPLDSYSAGGTNVIRAAVDPISITDVWWVGQLNDANVAKAPTRSGWQPVYADGCQQKVESASAAGVRPKVDVSVYSRLYPRIFGTVAGVAGDDPTALANGVFRSLRARPCSHTGREVA